MVPYPCCNAKVNSDTQVFSYDELDRLVTAGGNGHAGASIPAYSHSYGYDEMGNITNFAGESFTYEDSDHTHAVTHVDSAQRYTYDANGNMTGRVDGSTTYTQTFDIQNRLVQVRQSGSFTETTFAYDSGESRVLAVEELPGDTKATTTYPFPNYEEEVRQEWQYVEISRGVWVWQWETVATIRRSSYYFGGSAVATRVSGDPVPANNGLFYLHTDHLGSTSLLTNNSGQQVGNTIRYYPFGEYRTEPSTKGITDWGFTGHRQNDGLGLIYMRARYYVPGVGRFVSADSIVPDPNNPQGYSRFTYALNNPLSMRDPSGYPECEFDEYCIPPPAPLILGSPLVIFIGEVWTASEQAIILEATNRVAGRMASANNSQRRFASRVSGTEPTGYSALSAEDVGHRGN